MPRSSGSAAPRRPTAGPSSQSRAPSQPQKRPATTAAYPPVQQGQAARPQGQQQSPGLFGQMASTAAGVAVGSSIGHAVGGLFGGSSAAEPAQTNATATQSDMAQGAGPCQMDIQSFRQCMDENQGSLNICGWYLDQLKACQAAARQY